jgi:hypothetical protein
VFKTHPEKYTIAYYTLWGCSLIIYLTPLQKIIEPLPPWCNTFTYKLLCPKVKPSQTPSLPLLNIIYGQPPLHNGLEFFE